ncbi:hypothetical protein [Sporosarcina sp. NPDC096371]|uniref:hypothetical protein n=1 Tax=Sporosarcina sp. NPDC096371 TaxID=3364530 RepID=UPI00381C1E05
MQDQKPCEGQEIICVNVDKVYDWIVKEKSFELTPSGAIPFPAVTTATSLTGAAVTCDVAPAAVSPIVILHREDRTFCVDGKNVCLQQLTIQKNFDVTVIVTLPNGTTFSSAPISVSRCESATLCAPEGTDVTITYTDLDCFVCTTGGLTAGDGSITFTALTISVDTCQSIQSTFPVTVELLADYCEPRADIVAGCSPPRRPQPCSVVFPDAGGGNCCN